MRDIKKFYREKLWKYIEKSKTKKEKEVENKCINSKCTNTDAFRCTCKFSYYLPFTQPDPGCVEAVTPILIIQ
jgi:hypothetical protein